MGLRAHQKIILVNAWGPVVNGVRRSQFFLRKNNDSRSPEGELLRSWIQDAYLTCISAGLQLLKRDTETERDCFGLRI